MREAMFLAPFDYTLLYFDQSLPNILIIENNLESYFLYTNPLKLFFHSVLLFQSSGLSNSLFLLDEEFNYSEKPEDFFQEVTS